MRKSKDISKYNLKWQLARISNKKRKSLEDKLIFVNQFYKENDSKDNYERVINYLEGLMLPYKQEQRDKIKQAIDQLPSPTSLDNDINIKEVKTSELLQLYKDLYRRNDRWQNNNYKNKELNQFLKILFNELTMRSIKVDKNFDKHIVGKSHHKFIY